MSYANATIPTELRSSYVRRDFEGYDSDVKARERRRVLAWMLKLHGSSHARLLTFPGTRWRFEHLWRETWRGHVKFIALDRLVEAIDVGRDYMPGRGAQFRRWQYGPNWVEGVETDCARIAWMDSSVYFGCGRFELRMSKAQVAERRKVWRELTGMWLDYQSPITEAVLLDLRRAARALDMYADAAPIVVTVQHGRESGVVGGLVGIGADRGTLLERALNYPALAGQHPWRCKLVDSWIYQGVNETRMKTYVFDARQERA